MAFSGQGRYGTNIVLSDARRRIPDDTARRNTENSADSTAAGVGVRTVLGRWQSVVVVIGLAAAIAAGVWVWRAEPQPAPAAELVTIEGERFTLGALRGKVVLVSFWATDCAVCLREMPQMVATHRRFQSRGFESVFVSMPYDRPDHVVHYARKHQLPFKLALDVRGEINLAFGGVKLTPTTLVIDKRGRIVARILGEPDFARLHSLIEDKLREPA